MSIEIQNNTVVRLILRRGYDSDRRQVTLAEGEMGYTVDTKRIFVGDGQTVGGTIAANKFHGFVSSSNSITDTQLGDTCYDTTNRQSLVYTASGWVNTGPGFSNSSLEYSSSGIRIASSVVGTGLNLAYSAADVNNIYGNTNKIELDSRYWSLCTANYFTSGGFYLGNTSGLSTNLYPYRLGVDGPVILFQNGQTGSIILSGGSAPTIGVLGQILNFSTNTPSPCSFRFKGSVWVAGDMTVAGTLSAVSYATVITTVSSVTGIVVDLTSSVQDMSGIVIRNNDSDPQVMMTITNNNSQIFKCTNTPFIGLNTDTDARYSTANNLISGFTVVLNDTTKPFIIDQKGGGAIRLTTTGGILSAAANTMLLSAANLTVYGDLSATGDIIAFSTSDMTLKNNIAQIDNPLEKLLAIRGVEFDWSDSAKFSGHEIGVLAQEVERIIPSAVGTRHDGYKGVRYDRIVPLLIEAIRELKAKLDKLSS